MYLKHDHRALTNVRKVPAKGHINAERCGGDWAVLQVYLPYITNHDWRVSQARPQSQSVPEGIFPAELGSNETEEQLRDVQGAGTLLLCLRHSNMAVKVATIMSSIPRRMPSSLISKVPSNLQESSMFARGTMALSREAAGAQQRCRRTCAQSAESSGANPTPSH